MITTIDHRKILAIGYNGNAQGLPNYCDRAEVGNCGCLHSEENAAIHCDTPREQKKHVFVTHLPCPRCAKRLINLGSVQKVYYNQDYREDEALSIFSQVGIEITKYDLTNDKPLTF